MIQIPETIRDHWIFRNPFYFRQWFGMLMIAARADGYTYIGRRKVTYRRGEIAMSIFMLAGELGVHRAVLSEILRIFSSEKLLTIERKSKFSIIRMSGFDSYCPPEKNVSVRPTHPPTQKATDKPTHPPTQKATQKATDKPTQLPTDKATQPVTDAGVTPCLKKTESIDNIDNNIFHHHRARSRVREEKDRKGDEKCTEKSCGNVPLPDDAKFLGMVAANFRISERRAAELARTFSEEIAARGKTHSNSEDERMHFVYWLKKVLNVETNGFARKNTESDGGTGVPVAGGVGGVARHSRQRRAAEPEYGLIEE